MKKGMKMLLALTFLLLLSSALPAQTADRRLEALISDWLDAYVTDRANIAKCKLESLEVDDEGKSLRVVANYAFAAQPFTEEIVADIYRDFRQMLPKRVSGYEVSIIADGKPIEELIPNAYRKSPDRSRLYGKIDSKVKPWVENVSRPYSPTLGLQGRHVALWQSHGIYWKNAEETWKWQRPRLFSTAEDLYTQGIVVPFLIPMLENAGAVVFTPRERDWQRHEVIVDNDGSSPGSKYLEVNFKKKCRWKDAPGRGFAHVRERYQDGQNPFEDGKARFVTTINKPEKAFAEWIPNIPEDGRYAVYVSYQSLPESVDDAKYLVYHSGGVTEFKVNQQIGGGTWVYLGSFQFDKGVNESGMVVLSNECGSKGVVSADAVRFGGGMGNVSRGGGVSGMPRFLEGARYWAQWAGMPYQVYSHSEGTNDYNDDINVRSLMTNYLNGGSAYNPDEEGLGVPLELTLGFHSDAGFKTDDELVGTLGIYTTDFNEGLLASGVSRYASRDFADMVLTGIERDISASLGIKWARRSLWNRNYSETRLPTVPSMILESLSHQNFNDLVHGFDPKFQFLVGRSVYKSILKFISSMHGTRYVVQPLPVSHFMIEPGREKNTLSLSWTPREDQLELTASPDAYIVYTRIGYGGFDNGVRVNQPHHTVTVEPGLTYSFRVTAVNRGGESFPSETLAAYVAKKSQGTVMIVNGFHRTSGPAAVNTPQAQGFDLSADPGIPYVASTSFCGFQHCFDRKHPGRETADGLGYSGNELEGRTVVGNSFDYPFLHGKSIQRAGGYSFVSCSSEVLDDGALNLRGYCMVDYIYGAEMSPISETSRRALHNYCLNGGKLFLSGEHVGSCMSDNVFLEVTLQCRYGGSMRDVRSGNIHGAKINFNIPRSINPRTYAVTAPECLTPVDDSFSVYAYSDGNQSAAVASRERGTFVLGFPFESVSDAKARDGIMRAALQFLLK